MRSNTLQDLADRVPEVAATGLEHARRGGHLLVDSIPVSSIAAHVGDGVNRLNDLADRAGVPIPARLEKIGRAHRQSRVPSRGGLLAVLAAAAVFAVLRMRRARAACSAPGHSETGTADTINGDSTAMPSKNGLAKPRSGKSHDATVPNSNWH